MSSLQSFWYQVEGESLFLYHRLIGKTVRWQFYGQENLALANSYERPILWAFWHEATVPIHHVWRSNYRVRKFLLGSCW